jgi:hypothetical protein
MEASMKPASLKAMPPQSNIITIEKAMGMIKRYLQLTTVMAAKQRATFFKLQTYH